MDSSCSGCLSWHVCIRREKDACSSDVQHPSNYTMLYIYISCINQTVNPVLLALIINKLLVGGFNHLEKYESQWEGLSHTLWKIKFMFQTTNQYIYIYWYLVVKFQYPEFSGHIMVRLWIVNQDIPPTRYMLPYITIYYHILPYITIYYHILPNITIYYHICITTYYHILPLYHYHNIYIYIKLYI